MSEFDRVSHEKEFPEAAFDVATTVELSNGQVLLLGHTGFGDFRLQLASARGEHGESLYRRGDESTRSPQLAAYHSVEPSILAHTLLQLARGKTRDELSIIVVDILDRESYVQTAPLRYPGHSVDASIDRRYDKVYSQLPALLIGEVPLEMMPLTIHEEGSLEGHLYHRPEGILITDEQWDDDFEVVSEEGADDDEADFDLESLPKKELIIAELSNEDLPAFAAALIATARTDFGRVKHQDLVATVLSITS